MFNSGQIVAAKVRLLGAADAAAYSAALAEARALNFQAYMNRAIVANEVAIAQLVSLRSWSGYMNQLLQRSSTIASVVPPARGAAAMRCRKRGVRSIGDCSALCRCWNPPPATGMSMCLSRARISCRRADRRAGRKPGARRRTGQCAGSGRGGCRPGIRAAQRRALACIDRGATSALARSGRGCARWSWTRAMASRASVAGRLGLPPLASLHKRGGTDLIGYDAWRGMDTLALQVSVLFRHARTTPGLASRRESPPRRRRPR